MSSSETFFAKPNHAGVIPFTISGNPAARDDSLWYEISKMTVAIPVRVKCSVEGAIFEKEKANDSTFQYEGNQTLINQKPEIRVSGLLLEYPDFIHPPQKSHDSAQREHNIRLIEASDTELIFGGDINISLAELTDVIKQFPDVKKLFPNYAAFDIKLQSCYMELTNKEETISYDCTDGQMTRITAFDTQSYPFHFDVIHLLKNKSNTVKLTLESAWIAPARLTIPLCEKAEAIETEKEVQVHCIQNHYYSLYGLRQIKSSNDCWHQWQTSCIPSSCHYITVVPIRKSPQSFIVCSSALSKPESNYRDMELEIIWGGNKMTTTVKAEQKGDTWVFDLRTILFDGSVPLYPQNMLFKGMIDNTASEDISKCYYYTTKPFKFNVDVTTVVCSGA